MKDIGKRLAELKAKEPELTGAELAERLGVSRSTIRFQERKLAQDAAPAHEGIYQATMASFREKKRNAAGPRSHRKKA